MSSAPIHRISSNNTVEWRLWFPPRVVLFLIFLSPLLPLSLSLSRSLHALTAKCRGASLTEHHHKLANLQQWDPTRARRCLSCRWGHTPSGPPCAPRRIQSIEIRRTAIYRRYARRVATLNQLLVDIRDASMLIRRSGEWNVSGVQERKRKRKEREERFLFDFCF